MILPNSRSTLGLSRAQLGVVLVLLSGVCAAGRSAAAQDVKQIPKVELASTTQPATDPEPTPPMCKTELRLSGAVYNATRPERSFAMFQLTSSQRSAVYRVGTWVSDYQVLEVAPRGVLLRDAQGECWMQLVGDTFGPARRQAVAKRSSKTARAKKSAKRSQVVVVGSR